MPQSVFVAQKPKMPWCLFIGFGVSLFCKSPCFSHRGHALEKGHYVWMNAVDGKVYCIPDGYEVVDKSLEAGYPTGPPLLM